MRRMFSENQIQSLSLDTVQEMSNNGYLLPNPLYFEVELTAEKESQYNFVLPESIVPTLQKFRLFYIHAELVSGGDTVNYESGIVFDCSDMSLSHQLVYDDNNDTGNVYIAFRDGGEINFYSLAGGIQNGDKIILTIYTLL